jgi:hypothetical protein
MFKVPLLGQVPRILEITRGGDAGTPVTASQPDNPVSEIYREIAGGVARRVATLSMQSAGNFEAGRPLKTMEELRQEESSSKH